MVILDFPKAVFGNTLSYYNLYFKLYFISQTWYFCCVIILFLLLHTCSLICILVFCIIQKYTIPCVQTDNEDTLLSSFYNYVYLSIDGVERCIFGYIFIILEVCNEHLDVFILRKC